MDDCLAAIAESFQGGQGAAWALWALALLVLLSAAAFAWFCRIRITRTGGRGEIFSGVGHLGRTHGFAWGDFSDVRDHGFGEDTGRRTTRTAHDVQLIGPSATYRFGKDLDAVWIGSPRITGYTSASSISARMAKMSKFIRSIVSGLDS